MHLEKIRLDKIQNGRHYSLSHGRYLVNRARWLDHYPLKVVSRSRDPQL